MIRDLRTHLTRIRVPGGFILAGLYFYYSRPTPNHLWTGGAVAFLGLLVRAWATGHLRKNDELAVAGPYAFTRNPLYFGSFVIGVGFSLAGARMEMLVVFLLCFAALYGGVMQQEMDFLRQKFPEDYARYEAAVPLFFPRLLPGEVNDGRFSVQRYWQNREYQALLGFVAAIGVLVLKIRAV